MTHVCGEKKYFDDHIREFTKLSHENKSLKQHCEEIIKYFNMLFDFYSFKEKTLVEIGHFLAYYHDLGKLNPEWKIGKKQNPPHAPKSLEFINKWKIKFNANACLTPYLEYIILKHHGKLDLPTESAKTDGLTAVLKNLPIKKSGVDPRDIADIFGLFKIADTLSATEPRYRDKIEKLMVKKPRYNEGSVKCLVKKNFSEERWQQQLKIKNLPDIALLRAPTGWGKTTVSLLFPLKKSCNRVFYLLPTITAINKFYDNLNRIFKNEVSKYFYFYDTEIKENDERLNTMFFVKNFLTPIVITTMDQFLLSFLQCGRYHTRRVAFRNSGIIIDEVHLLNPLMLKLLSFFFQEYKQKYGLKLLLMSATLPNAYKKYFELKFKLHNNSFLDFGQDYKTKRRVIFDLQNNDITENINKIFDEYHKKKRKVLVVVNTVEKAIMLGKNLIRTHPREKNKILIFHARFMYRDRKRKENLLEKMNKIPHILIATQVCEVSLDISYDTLYTEAAPIAAIMQRFGRVNRYGEWGKKYIGKPNAHIHYPKELRDSKKATHYPYEKNEVDMCWDILSRLASETLKNEWELITEFDSQYPFELLEKNLENISREVNLDIWKELLQMFYSFNIEEENLRNIIEYRSSFTTSVILAPEMMVKKERAKEMENLLEKCNKWQDLVFIDRMRLFAKIKENSLPLPVWWLREAEVGHNVFPFVNIPDRKYDSTYGLIQTDLKTVI